MSSGGGSETVVNRSEPPAWAVPYYQGYLQQGTRVANLPYQPYTGQRVAPINPAQATALGATAGRALSGTPEASAGREELTRTLGGGYLGAQAPTNQYMSAANPFAGAVNPFAGTTNPSAGAMNPFAGATNPSASAMNQFAGTANQAAGVMNPFAGVTNTSIGTNPYLGSNPYLQQQIDAAQGDVVRNYNLSAAPTFASANARSGSFGHSGLAEMENESRRQLANELGRISSGMRFGDYTTQQQLAESDIGRRFQSGENLAQRLFGAGSQQAGQLYQSGENLAQRLFGAGSQQAGQQFQAGENLAQRLFGAGSQQAGQQFQAGENLAQRLYGAGAQQAGQQFQSGENLAQRLFGGGESQASRQQQMYEAERQRMLGALGAVPQFSSMDYLDASQLMNVGDVLQRQQQALLNADRQSFDEARSYPLQQLDIIGRTLGQNYGQSQTSQQPGQSPLSGALGGALAGGALTGMLPSAMGAALGPWGLIGGAALGLLG